MRNLRNDELQRIDRIRKTKDRDKLRIAIYARKSTEDKADISIHTQVEYCREFIHKYDSLFQLDENHIFSEEDVSGYYTDRRHEFNRLLSMIESDEVDVIVSSKQSRIARKSRYREPLLERISNANSYLIMLDDTTDDSAAGTLTKQIIWDINEFQIRNIAENVMKVHTNLVQNGKTVGGPGNYGYKVVDRKYVQEPTEALAVSLIYDLFLGGKSYSQIAEELESKGYKPRKSTRFSNSTLYDILTNRRNCGESVWNAESKRKNRERILKEVYEEVISEEVVLNPIISKAKFERVQQLLSSKAKGVIQKKGHVYLLTGLLKCSCGASLTGYSNKKKGRAKPHRTYQCRHHSKRYGNTCGTKAINAEYLDKAIKKQVISIINQHYKSNPVIQAICDNYVNEEKAQIRRLNNEINTIDSKLDVLLMGYHSEPEGAIKDRTKSNIEKLTKVIELSKTKRKRIRLKVRNANDRIKRINNASMRISEVFTNDIVARKIVQIFIDEIRVNNDGIEILLKEAGE